MEGHRGRGEAGRGIGTGGGAWVRMEVRRGGVGGLGERG